MIMSYYRSFAVLQYSLQPLAAMINFAIRSDSSQFYAALRLISPCLEGPGLLECLFEEMNAEKCGIYMFKVK